MNKLFYSPGGRFLVVPANTKVHPSVMPYLVMESEHVQRLFEFARIMYLQAYLQKKAFSLVEVRLAWTWYNAPVHLYVGPADMTIIHPDELSDIEKM